MPVHKVKVLGVGAASGAAATVNVYTVPANKRAGITQISFKHFASVIGLRGQVQIIRGADAVTIAHNYTAATGTAKVVGLADNSIGGAENATSDWSVGKNVILETGDIVRVVTTGVGTHNWVLWLSGFEYDEL